MRRFAFDIRYNGKNYVGWQRQANGISIQEKIEDTLNKLFNSQDIQIVGCGRTDAGVHASNYFFHVDLDDRFKPDELAFKLNRMLPDDISIRGIYPVPDDFHARFDARERIYRYFLNREKNPFSKGLSLFFHQEPNIEEMNEACRYLIGRQDFSSFSKSHTDVKTNICTINYARWERTSADELFFEISADRFLRNMVRAIVGTLIEVGIGKIPCGEVKSIIEKKNRGAAKHSVSAHGLFLWEVKYDEEKLKKANP